MEDKSNGVPSTPDQGSKSEEAQATGKVLEVSSPYNSPKTPRDVWNRVKIDFELQNFKTLKELALRHNVPYQDLRNKVYKGKWNEEQRTLQRKVTQVIQEKTISLAERQSEYLLRLSKRGEKYERIIDASMEHLGSKDANGTPLLDPEAIDQYTRSENRVMELNRISLKIPVASQIDHTSGGMDVVTIIGAIAKLRESKDTPKLEDSDVDRILDAGVE